MAEENIKFYMQKDGESELDIESHFVGMRYSKCVGLLDKGKRKDVYTEEYPDSDVLRVWQGDEVKREATSITFTFYFIGENRHNVYEEFYKYVSNGKILYHDTKRKKYAYLILIEATSPKEDNYKGSLDYTVVDFKFQNLWGECKDPI